LIEKHLTNVAVPSHLKQLDIPPSDFGVLCIPDSVEVVTGSVEAFGVHDRVLKFGRKSRLIEIKLIRCAFVRRYSIWESAKASQYAIFVHLSEEILGVFRGRLEEI
jgi:hypothetical protein